MSHIIALAGKGGTGKTTIAALLARLLKESGLGPILAVDADPNSNLSDALGMEAAESIGMIVDDIAARADRVPQGMTKDRFVEYRVQAAVAEGDGIDCLSMGRSEGPGCYCYVNNVLRAVMEKLIRDYRYVIIDNEAGLEHLSRRTTRRADDLIVVTDATVTGLKSAARISDLAKELRIDIKRSYLLVNRAEISSLRGATPSEARGSDEAISVLKPRLLRPKNGFAMTGFEDKIEDIGIDCLGCLPFDRAVMDISLNGCSLMELEGNSPALSALRQLGEKIWHCSRQ